MNAIAQVEFVPAAKKIGTVSGIYAAPGDGFVSQAVEKLTLTYEGIPGDNHAGLLRKSGGREPWYERGTEMRNERQVSLLGAEELAEVAAALKLDELKPEWIGGNLVIAGIPHFSLLPARTLLFFEGGVTLRIDGDNGPCRIAGKSIADHVPGRGELEFEFPKVAQKKRGLVGWVEREGVIEPGEKVTARIWEQWIYPV